MEKRTLAAIALSILILFLFKYIEDRRMGDTARRQPPAKPQAVAPAPPVPAPPPSTAPPVEMRAELETTPGDTAATAQKTVIDGQLYRAELDNRGGTLSSWELKQFKSGRGEVFEMIPPIKAGEIGTQPGAILLEDAALNTVINSDAYAVEAQGVAKPNGDYTPPVIVSLSLRRGDLTVRKTYAFDAARYVVDYQLSVERGGRPLPGKLVLGQDLGPEYEHLLNPSATLRAVSSQGGKVSRESPPKDENEVKAFAGDIRWVGLEMQYFALLGIPKGPVPAFEIQRKPVKTVALDGKEISRDLLRVTIPGAGSWHDLLFLGPKQPSALEAVKNVDVSGVIDYGFFSFLVRPLLASLNFIQRYVRNYGVAIIILTLLLTILLFPFRLKQMLSMKKMAVVQPKIKAIQERYRKYKKTDPKRAEMNQEIMALYKEHNVNPLGGCLPLILQMPLLFAFYSLLAASIELRQAPFVGWIHDLSLKDPYYILPIVMGITMFVQQKITPMAPGADPTQAKMMMVMPAVFTVMFLNVSSGLNLYFLCSNIFSIAIQKAAERWIGDSGVSAKA